MKLIPTPETDPGYRLIQLEKKVVSLEKQLDTIFQSDNPKEDFKNPEYNPFSPNGCVFCNGSIPGLAHVICKFGIEGGSRLVDAPVCKRCIRSVKLLHSIPRIEGEQ